jgi:hypothetical protein
MVAMALHSLAHASTCHTRAHHHITATDAVRIKMVAMATQKFVADVATDALQHCKQRQVRR